MPRVLTADPCLKLKPTIIVLGLALAMRVLVIWTVVTHYPPQWLFTRGMEMGLLAKSLLAGTGLSSPFGGSTGPTAFVAPVYPILVAAVFKVFGEYSVASAVTILVAQTVMNLITIWLMMQVARRLFNQTTATVAGLVWACSLPLVWMPTILWETSLSCCLLTGLLALVLQYRSMHEVGPIQWMTLGGYCGVCGLVNPALLPSVAAVVLWLAYVTRERKTAWPLLSALTFVLVFAPWPIRNARALHAFIPLRTTVGFELWMGNREGATGFLDESLFPAFNRNELADYVRRGEVGYSANKSALARRYIASHPREFLELTARRSVRFWSGTGTNNGSKLFAVHGTLTTLFGCAALALLVWRRRYALAGLFALPMALFPLPYVITHAEFRYRLVIDPLMTVLCAYAVVELCAGAIRSEGHSPAASLPCEGRLRVPEAAAWRAS
jgi:4-amino-4-deoxy-L-arabinose transferase-like glycosyltransferase